MKEVTKMKRNSILLIIAVVSFGVFLFVGLKTTSSFPRISSSPHTIQEIESAFLTTKHMEIKEYLGTTLEGRTIFTYRWKDYGIVDVFSCRAEERRIRNELKINDR